MKLMRSLTLLAVSIPGGGIPIPDIGDPTPTPFPIVKDGYSCKNCFDNIVLGPYDIYGYSTEIIFKVSFEANLSEPATIDLEIENSGYELVFDTIEVTERKQTITYTYDNLYTYHSGINAFIFTLRSEFGTDTRRMMGRKRQYENVIVSENDQENETSDTVVYYERKSGTTTFKTEKYRFSGYSDLIYQPANQPYDISSFYFKYECADLYTPSFGNCYFLIKGLFANYYSDVGITIGSFRGLTLTPHYDSSTKRVTFTVNEDLYVDPVTQKMSSTPREGLIKTTKLYFPANIPDETSFYFGYSFVDCGANQIKITADTQAKIMKSAMGNCFDSKYCISTNEAYPDVDLGEKIVH